MFRFLLSHTWSFFFFTSPFQNLFKWWPYWKDWLTDYAGLHRWEAKLHMCSCMIGEGRHAQQYVTLRSPKVTSALTSFDPLLFLFWINAAIIWIISWNLDWKDVCITFHFHYTVGVEMMDTIFNIVLKEKHYYVTLVQKISIHYLLPLILCRVTGEAGAYPSWHCAKGGVHNNNLTRIRTTTGNLESPIHQLACLWRRSWRTQREPMQTRGEHANSRQRGPDQDLLIKIKSEILN